MKTSKNIVDLTQGGLDETIGLCVVEAADAAQRLRKMSQRLR